MPRNSGGGTAIYLLGSLLEGVLGMAFTVVLVRLILPDEFGAWRQFALLAGITWNIATYGLSRSLGYYFSVAPIHEQGAIARRTLWLCLGLAGAGFLLFYFGLPFAAQRFDSPQLADEALLFALLVIWGFPSQVVIALLLAAGRRTQLALTKLTFSLLRLAALVVLIWSDATLHNFLLALNAFGMLQFALMMVLYWRAAGPVQSPVWNASREQRRFAGDLTLQSAVGQFGAEMDKLLVSSSFAPAKFAAYSVGARELPLVPLIPFTIAESIGPDLSRMAVAGKLEEFREHWHLWIKRAALLMYPVFALVLFQHRAIVEVLYTAEYLEGALPLLIIGCVIPQRITSFYHVLLCLNQSRTVLWASVAMLCSNALLSLLFMKFFGLWGPALAVLISEYVINGAVAWRIGKLIGVGPLRVLPWGYLGKLLTIAVAAGALALPVLGLIHDGGALLRLAAYGCVMLVIYGAAVLSLGLVGREDLAQVRSALRGR